MDRFHLLVDVWNSEVTVIILSQAINRIVHNPGIEYIFAYFSLVDYILMDPGERQRLHIKEIPKPFPQRYIYFEQCSFLSAPVKRLICSQLGHQPQSACQTEQSSQNEDWHSMIYAKNPKCLFILGHYLSAFIEHSVLVNTQTAWYVPSCAYLNYL